MAAKKSTEIVPTMLRMREEMRKRLEREAKRNDRSLNAEMVERIIQVDNIVDVLVGKKNETSSDLVRRIAFELSLNPNWTDDPQSRQEMTKGLSRRILGFAFQPEQIDRMFQQGAI